MAQNTFKENQERRFLVALKTLKDNRNEIDRLIKRMQEIRPLHYEYETIERELRSLENKNSRLYKYLEICNALYSEELREIAKKIIQAKENSDAYKDKDSVLFDDIRSNFVSYSEGNLTYNISLLYTHFRHYDLKVIMQRIEEITNLHIKEYYLLLGEHFIELSLTLIKNKEGG